MVLSRAQRADIMTHILENIFDQDPDSNLHKSLKHNGILSPHDLCAEDEAQFDGYKYPTDTKKLDTLTRGSIGLLKSFKRFVAHKTALGQPIGDTDWL
jgi:hypothetical protein